MIRFYLPRFPWNKGFTWFHPISFPTCYLLGAQVAIHMSKSWCSPPPNELNRIARMRSCGGNAPPFGSLPKGNGPRKGIRVRQGKLGLALYLSPQKSLPPQENLMNGQVFFFEGGGQLLREVKINMLNRLYCWLQFCVEALVYRHFVWFHGLGREWQLTSFNWLSPNPPSTFT